MFEIGQKVVPIDKTPWGNLEKSRCWERAKQEGRNYLYYNGVSECLGIHICGDRSEKGRGDYFSLSDLIAYEESKQIKLQSYFVIRCHVNVEGQSRFDSVSVAYNDYPSDEIIENYINYIESLNFEVYHAYVEKRYNKVVV